MTSSDSALSTATRNSTDTYTRITNPRRLRLIRVVWSVLMLLNIILFVLGMVEYASEIRRGCLCNTIRVSQRDGEIVLSPLPQGPAVGLIEEGDVLIAVDDTPLPPQALADDATSLITSGEVGTPVTLTIRSSGESTRDVTLTRVALYSSIHAGMKLGLSLDGVIAYRVILYIFVFVFYVALAVFIAWRRSDDWMALYAAWALLAFELVDVPALAMFLGAYPSFWTNLLFATFNIMVANFALLFPNGRFAPRGSLVAAVLFGLWMLWLGVRQYNLWESAVGFVFGLIFVGIIIYRFRYVFTPTQRQQTKWALFGIVTAILVIQGDGVLRGIVLAIGGYEAGAFFSFFVYPLVRIAALLIPVTMVVAVLRHRLWDIDLTLNRSLVYGSVALLLGALFFVQFLIAQAVLGALLGSSQSGIAIAISAVATGALFNPARKRAQHIVDRQLYGFRFDLNELQAAQKTSEIKNPGALTGRTLGAYQVLGVIGKGGMGEVYQGQRNSQTVAIKILPEDLARQEDFRKRFAREAQTLADFDHPNIVKMYDSGQTDGIFYMAMEYVEGQELAHLIKQQGAIPFEQVRPFIQDFAAALDYAHSKGLVHRDIKPSNIMIRLKADKETQEAVLMDFGIAKIQDVRTGITGTGAIGTIDYMAPEQIMAAKAVDHRADIYALGVVLYEMLTGERPFKGSAGQVLFAHLQQPPPDSRDVRENIPANVAHALMRAMSKKPEDRFQSVGEFAAALA